MIANYARARSSQRREELIRQCERPHQQSGAQVRRSDYHSSDYLGCYSSTAKWGLEPHKGFATCMLSSTCCWSDQAARVPSRKSYRHIDLREVLRVLSAPSLV
jgi:hypothetical protein